MPPPPAGRTRGGKKKPKPADRTTKPIERVPLRRKEEVFPTDASGRKPKTMSVAEKRLTAWDLRIEGYSVPQIAETLELSEVRTYELIREYSADIAKYTEFAREQYREMELARLDKLLVSHWKYRDITKNAQVILNILERKHKLLGLESTHKHVTVDTPDAGVTLANLDLAKLSNQELEWLEIIITKAMPVAAPVGNVMEGQFQALPNPNAQEVQSGQGVVGSD